LSQITKRIAGKLRNEHTYKPSMQTIRMSTIRMHYFQIEPHAQYITPQSEYVQQREENQRNFLDSRKSHKHSGAIYSQSSGLTIHHLLGITCWRVPISLSICWLGWVPNLRWNGLINARHLLNWGHSHHSWWPKLPISLIHFDLVLCLRLKPW